jgi:alpha-glucosidase
MKKNPQYQTKSFSKRSLARVLALLAVLGLLQLSPGAVHGAGAPAGTSTGGWQTAANFSTPAWDGKTLLFHGPSGSLAIIPISDDVIRVRFSSAASLGRDHSYAVIDQPAAAPAAKVENGAGSTVLRTVSLQVTVHYSPLKITFANAAGEILDEDDSDCGTASAGSAARVSKRLQQDDHVYGFGEKTGRLDKRGWKLGGYSYVMWNSDTFAYDSSTDPLYVSVPFYLTVRHGQAHGVFLDNTGRSTFDVGRERPDLLSFETDIGGLNYYFISGPTPKEVVKRYAALTGKLPLPPLWSLGYNQCRYSYYPESRVRLLADTFREKKIPADVIWLDIHYQDNYKPFTWDSKRFPDPKRMISDLRAQGFRVVCIVDGHPKAERGYAPYDSGLAGDAFLKRPDGSIFEGPVWPSRAAHNPGPSVFPDFSRPATREWWGALYKSFTDIGVAGIWNDMNEPALFNTPTGTLPLDIVFDNDGQPATHRELHNAFGELLSRSTYEGLSRLRPNERAFVLTRASYAGGQRYAAVWTGDNTAEWASLRQSISTLLGLGVSGFSFVGSDIGGFANPESGELYSRWLQAAVFYPFMRSHTTFGTPDKEPWSFGYQYEAINKRSIELRYELLPHIYNVMHESSETGLPAMRPLFLEYPADEHAASVDDEFLFGADLLIAPVLWEAATEREVYLPPGDWYDYWTGNHHRGGTIIRVPVSLNSIPIFVRAGGFVFQQPVVEDTDQMPGNALRVLVSPASDSEAEFYEDDGESRGYLKGDFCRRRFHQVRSDDGAVTIEVSAAEGTYRPKTRDLFLQLWAERPPGSVFFRTGNGTAKLPQVKAEELNTAVQGWVWTDGKLLIKEDNRSDVMQFTIRP